MTASETPVESIAASVSAARAYFDTGVTRDLGWRKEQLRALDRLLSENEAALCNALYQDLRKSEPEAMLTEISVVRSEISHAIKHLRRWAEPRRASLGLGLQPASARITPEPLGVMLIIAPWNYPIQLLLSPLIGAIAAGNTAILKPSEISSHTSATIAKLVPRYLDTQAYAVVEGGVPQTTELLTHRFDHIVYTGNGVVARIVMKAAAEHLTPVTLELGGKSPAWVDHNSRLDDAARMIVWTKFINAGQTCIAPDYILTPRALVPQLTDALRNAITELYGDEPLASPDLGRIINERQFERLRGYLDGAQPSGNSSESKGYSIVIGGEVDPATRGIAPTVVLMDKPLDPATTRTPENTPAVMLDEIFGPILPIVPVDSLDDAIAYVNAGDKPLALYVFTPSTAVRRAFVERTSSGAVGLDNAVIHASAGSLPFGGVGASGMGAYHGKHSFDAFSHAKPVLFKPLRPALLRLLQPPFTSLKARIMRRAGGAG